MPNKIKPIKVDLVQGTPEWLEWRRGLKIGGSEASVIMGVNRYTSVQELFLRKLGLIPEVQVNEAMERGHRLEPEARVEFELESGISVVPACYTHGEREWQAVSLDGINIDETVITEIKCPGLKTHSEALGGKVPVIYYPQVQHEIATVEADHGYYYSYTDIPDVNNVLLPVKPDRDFIERMVAREELFIGYLRRAIEKIGNGGTITEEDYPPPDLFGVPDAGTNRADYERADPKFLETIRDYLAAKAVFDDAQAQLRSREQAIVTQMARKKQILAIGGGVRVERQLLDNEWHLNIEVEGE